MSNLIYKNMEKAIEIIRENQNIFIVSHINPDGDNIGSMLALALALKKLNKNIIVLKSDYVPEDFKFLPGSNSIVEYDENFDPIDVLIAVDSSDEDRLGDNKSLLKKAKNIINIDHHISNSMFGHVNIVDDNAGATAEIIYTFIKKIGVDLDKDIGTNLYTGISTDTGKFSYESVTSNTHRIVAELIDLGVDFNKININIYENMTMEKTKLFTLALSTLKTYKNNTIAAVRVTQEMLNESGANIEDTEGIVSFIRKIGTVEVACLLKEISEEDIKVSLRSKKYVDVASVCECFNGGGHVRAAGCSINSSIDEAEKSIVNKIKEFIR